MAEEKEEWGFIINLNEGMNLAIERLKSCGAKNVYEAKDVSKAISNDLKFIIADLKELQNAKAITTCYLEPFNQRAYDKEFKFTIGKGFIHYSPFFITQVEISKNPSVDAILVANNKMYLAVSKHGQITDFNKTNEFYEDLLKIHYFTGFHIGDFYVSGDLSKAHASHGFPPKIKIFGEREIREGVTHKVSGKEYLCMDQGGGPYWYMGKTDDRGDIIDFSITRSVTSAKCIPTKEFASCNGWNLDKVKQEEICLAGEI